MSTGYGFEIALRDIQAGEQITDEYGIFNLVEGMSLLCSEPGCRGCIRPEDFDDYYSQWDDPILATLPYFNTVEQPLYPLVDAPTQASLERFLGGQAPYRSVYALRYRGSVVAGAGAGTGAGAGAGTGADAGTGASA